MVPPLALLIASRRRGTLSAKFRTRAAGICCHAPCKAFQSSAAVLGSRRLAAVLTSCHKFSIGFASGDFGGQSNSVTSCWRSHCLVDRDVWIGALSCWKTKSSPISAAASASMCSSRTCRYAVLQMSSNCDDMREINAQKQMIRLFFIMSIRGPTKLLSLSTT